jgi:fatty acid desaturase
MSTRRCSPGDGRFCLRISAIVLILSGLFALCLGVAGRFLPHDERFLGMTANQLCSLHGCRIVHFMVHDRVSFGGAVLAVGSLYVWLVEFPLRQGQAWAWWALLLSGLVGFSSFLAYLGYGYLDTWHGLATLGLLPGHVLGLIRSRRTLAQLGDIRSALDPPVRWPWNSAPGLGRACLLLTSAGLVLGGGTILAVGMTCVFVPQDLAYMGLGVKDLYALNPRLVPLIAHDRAGFGGAVCSCGVALFFSVWCGTPSPQLWCVLAAVGVSGFGTAIAVHPAVGYDDAVHLAPAVLGAVTYLVGLALTLRPMTSATADSAWAPVTAGYGPPTAAKLPSLRELGADLLRVPAWRRLLTLALPFVWCGLYFGFASMGWWPLAIFAVAALNFVTYGSTSHDLVHGNLGLPRRANDILLCLVELLALRSGHAYQAVHLHHHARYPHDDDIEAAAARRSLLGALAEGPAFQVRVWLWATRRAKQTRAWVIAEGGTCLALAVLAVALWPTTPVPLVYVASAVMGGWIFPLATSFVPHDPGGKNELTQTRAFRGWVAATVAFGHLYHLEHHLYPSVPHHNWPRLARRLDPYLERTGIKPVRLLF